MPRTLHQFCNSAALFPFTRLKWHAFSITIFVWHFAFYSLNHNKHTTHPLQSSYSKQVMYYTSKYRYVCCIIVTGKGKKFHKQPINNLRLWRSFSMKAAGFSKILFAFYWQLQDEWYKNKKYLSFKGVRKWMWRKSHATTLCRYDFKRKTQERHE